MTDNQWKDNLRVQLEDWEEVEEFLKSEKTEEALKKIEKIKARISQIPRRKQRGIKHETPQRAGI